MRTISMEDVVSSLDCAIIGRLCVDAWLGHGHVLFIGFGNSLLLPAVTDDLDPRPECELQTDFADWWIEESGCVLAASTDERTSIEAAAYKLLGRKALAWRFIEPSPALRIDFEAGLSVLTAPMKGAGVLHKGAWALRMPDACYRMVKWDGTLYLLRADEPASLEP